MRIPLLPALLSLALLASSAPAAIPPIPEDLTPREWKPDKDLRTLLDRFENLRTQEEAKEHLADVEAMLARHPESLDVHRHYVGVSRVVDRWADTQAKYEALFAADSTDADLQYLVGLFMRGEDAVKAYSRALELAPDHYFARCGLGLAHLTLNPPQTEEALPILFDAARARPDHPYAYQGIALAYEMAKEWEMGSRARQLSALVEPESFQPVGYEARDLQQMGKNEEAIARIEAFVQDHSKNPDGLRGLVKIYGDNDRAEDALKTQVRLAEMAEDNPEEAYNAACLLAKGDQKTAALEWLSKAADRGYDNHRHAKTDPDLASLREDGAFENALAEMRKAREKKIPEERERVLAQLIENPAPEFAVTTLDSVDVSLAGLRGKVVVLDFWATWCGPCRMTLPLVRDLHAAVKDKPVQILCMNVWERDPGRLKVAPYWKENEYPMTVGLAEIKDATNYGVTGIPTLVVIDTKGTMRFRHVGYTPYMDEEIGWVIDALLSEGERG